MFGASSPLAHLMDAPGRQGTLVWIGVRPARRARLLSVGSVLADTEVGLAGDHYQGSRRSRQVTLIGREQVDAIASFLGLDEIAPERLRRNLVTTGINPMALRSRRFRIGSAVLEGTGECHPCSRMEEEFGHGGYNAVRGHGGITARIVVAGVIEVGSTVDALAGC